MMATMLGLVDPGDEIIIFEPFYENYGPDTLISGGKPVYVPLRRVGDSFKFDPDELRKAFSEKTKAVIITTPHNPSGKVYSDEELGASLPNSARNSMPWSSLMSRMSTSSSTGLPIAVSLPYPEWQNVRLP